MEETSRFALIFDKWFDLLNVRSFKEGVQSRKPFLYPYRNGQDKRLEVRPGPVALLSFYLECSILLQRQKY